MDNNSIMFSPYNKNELYFINYFDLEIKGVINGYKKLGDKNLLINLNEKEVLLADKRLLSIINIENCQIKLNIKCENQINALYKLNDIFSTGKLSPVKVDSTSFKLLDVTILASA